MTRQALRHRESWQKLTRPTLLVFAFFYLGFHAISGERGLYAWLREGKRLEDLKAELASTTAERQAYEKKIRLLESNSINLDMLDEEARRTLGYTDPDEVVVFNPQPSQ